MSIHNGKIGRLPGVIREELNQRLADGEPGGTVLDWLNRMPEVRCVLAAQFEGAPISAMNLSRWRTGGYQDWHRERERRRAVRELSAEGVEQGVEAAEESRWHGSLMSRNLSRVFTADLAVAARDLLNNLSDPKERLEHLRRILKTVVHLRRDEQRTARFEFESERGAVSPK